MPMTPQEALQRTIEHREIFHDEMVDLMRQVMRGEVSPVMTAAILSGLRVKKETIGEIAGAATVMREFSRAVDVPDKTHLVDIVGTGGDGSHTFNISTASMFVAAAAGAAEMARLAASMAAPSTGWPWPPSRAASSPDFKACAGDTVAASRAGNHAPAMPAATPKAT